MLNPMGTLLSVPMHGADAGDARGPREVGKRQVAACARAWRCAAPDLLPGAAGARGDSPEPGGRAGAGAHGAPTAPLARPRPPDEPRGAPAPGALPLPAPGSPSRAQARERVHPARQGRDALGHAVSPGSSARPHALLGGVHVRTAGPMLGPGRSRPIELEPSHRAWCWRRHRSLTQPGRRSWTQPGRRSLGHRACPKYTLSPQEPDPSRPAGDVGRAAARARQAARVHAVAALHSEELPAAHQPASQCVPGARAPMARRRPRPPAWAPARPGGSCLRSGCGVQGAPAALQSSPVRGSAAVSPATRAAGAGAQSRRAQALWRRSARRRRLPGAGARRRARARAQVEGVSDVRQARGLPVYTVGSCSVQGLRNLLSHVRPPPFPGPLGAQGCRHLPARPAR